MYWFLISSVNCCFRCRNRIDPELSSDERERLRKQHRCCNCIKPNPCKCGDKLRTHCDLCCCEEVELFTKEAKDIQKQQCCCCTPKQPCCIRKCTYCCDRIREGTCCQSTSSKKQPKMVYKLTTRGRVYVNQYLYIFPL